MDEQQFLTLRRSLWTVKVMLGVLLVTLLAGVAILAFIAYKTVTFTTQVDNKVNQIQNTAEQKLNLKYNLCDSGQFNQTITQQLCR